MEAKKNMELKNLSKYATQDCDAIRFTKENDDDDIRPSFFEI